MQAHPHPTASSTVKRGEYLCQALLYTAVEDGVRMQAHLHPTPPSTAEKGNDLC